MVPTPPPSAQIAQADTTPGTQNAQRDYKDCDQGTGNVRTTATTTRDTKTPPLHKDQLGNGEADTLTSQQHRLTTKTGTNRIPREAKAADRRKEDTNPRPKQQRPQKEKKTGNAAANVTSLLRTTPLRKSSLEKIHHDGNYNSPRKTKDKERGNSNNQDLKGTPPYHQGGKRKKMRTNQRTFGTSSPAAPQHSVRGRTVRAFRPAEATTTPAARQQLL